MAKRETFIALRARRESHRIASEIASSPKLSPVRRAASHPPRLQPQAEPAKTELEIPPWLAELRDGDNPLPSEPPHWRIVLRYLWYLIVWSFAAWAVWMYSDWITRSVLEGLPLPGNRTFLS